MAAPVVGIIPAAGHAVRLQPLTHSKEMIPVGGRPVIDYLVERMRAGGSDELRVVTRPEKEDLRAYAEGVGAMTVLGHPETINDSIARGMAGLHPDAVVLVGFPDSVWDPVDGFCQLVDAVQDGAELALGLFRSPGLEGADAVYLDGSGQIADIEIKPRRPGSDWIWGVAAARVAALAGLDAVEWPSQLVNSLLASGADVRGIRLSDVYLDIGTPSSLRRVTEEGWSLEGS